MMTLFWCYLAIGSLIALGVIVKGPPKEYADATIGVVIVAAFILLIGWLPIILGAMLEKAID